MLVRSLLVHSMLPCAASVRIDEGVDLDLDGGQLQDDSVQAFEQAVEAGAALAEGMTCESLVESMKSELETAEKALTGLFADPTKEDAVVESSDAMMAFADQADKRKCLPKIMLEAHEKVKGLLEKHLNDTLLRNATSWNGIEKNPANLLKNAYGKLLAWQQGTYQLASETLERSTLFPEDIEANCPEPCGMCTRDHNSWRKGEENFKFKCLLKRGQPAPSASGLECPPPRRRRSFWRPHRWGRKTWCEVKDWKKSACIQMKMSAVSACGAKVILAELAEKAGWVEMYGHLYRPNYLECVEQEMKLDVYLVGNIEPSKHVPKQNYVAFNLVMTLGFINGLAALRDGSTKSPSVDAKSLLLDPFLQEHVVDSELETMFSKAFDSATCAIDFLETCEPQWKRKLDAWPTKVRAFISNFLVHGFWTTFWGGLTFFGNLMLLAALGVATTGLGAVYLVVATTMASLFGFVTAGLHCAGSTYYHLTPRVCSWAVGKSECDAKYPSYRTQRGKGETWTDLIEEARHQEETPGPT